MTKRVGVQANINNLFNTYGVYGWSGPGGFPAALDRQGFTPEFVRAKPDAVYATQGSFTGTNTYRVRHAKGHFVWTSNSFLLLDFEDGRPNKLLGDGGSQKMVRISKQEDDHIVQEYFDRFKFVPVIRGRKE